VDALVLRDRDANGQGGDGLEERLWVQQDANFNVTALVNASGSVVERYVYDPYGSVTVLNGSWQTQGSSAYGWQYLHQVGRLDTTSGLYNFRMRDYSPGLGRWAGIDPVGFVAEDTNLYRSVANSPANVLDPSGLRGIFDMGWEKDEYKGGFTTQGITAIPPRPGAGDAAMELDAMMQQRGNLMAQGRPVPPLMAGSLPIYGNGNQNAFQAMHDAGQLIYDMNATIAKELLYLVPGMGPVVGAYDVAQGIRNGDPLQVAGGALPFLHVPRLGRPAVRPNPLYRPRGPIQSMPRGGMQYFGGLQEFRSRTGKYTEPTLPPSTIARSGGVTIRHYTRGNDHLPAHAHVTGEGEPTRIGANGKPLVGDPPLSPQQKHVVEAHSREIRSAINRIRRWWKYMCHLQNK
jgi:RHS repeat-associated protein